MGERQRDFRTRQRNEGGAISTCCGAGRWAGIARCCATWCSAATSTRLHLPTRSIRRTETASAAPFRTVSKCSPSGLESDRAASCSSANWRSCSGCRPGVGARRFHPADLADAPLPAPRRCWPAAIRGTTSRGHVLASHPGPLAQRGDNAEPFDRIATRLAFHPGLDGRAHRERARLRPAGASTSALSLIHI